MCSQNIQGVLNKKVEIMKLFKFHQKLLDMHLEYRILFTTLVLFCFVLKKKKCSRKCLLLTSPEKILTESCHFKDAGLVI